jgi:hypothetical protein
MDEKPAVAVVDLPVKIVSEDLHAKPLAGWGGAIVARP